MLNRVFVIDHSITINTKKYHYLSYLHCVNQTRVHNLNVKSFTTERLREFRREPVSCIKLIKLNRTFS